MAKIPYGVDVHGVLRARAERVLQRVSSGSRTQRGGITHCGNTHLRTQLVESAWAYKSRPSVGATMARRQEGLDPGVVARAWGAQMRLCGKFRRLDEPKANRKVTVTAIARELAGFVWAEMTAA